MKVSGGETQGKKGIAQLSSRDLGQLLMSLLEEKAVPYELPGPGLLHYPQPVHELSGHVLGRMQVSLAQFRAHLRPSLSKILTNCEGSGSMNNPICPSRSQGHICQKDP